MGNKFTTSFRSKGVKSQEGKPSAAFLFSQKQDPASLDDSALQTELQAAQENALKLSADVDMLADELRLEAQLAALDEEDIDHQPGTEGVDDDLDLNDLDPEELAELEGELQELEREMMGAAGDRDNEMADVAAVKSEEGARSGGEQPGSERVSATGAGQGAWDTCSGPQDAPLPSAPVDGLAKVSTETEESPAADRPSTAAVVRPEAVAEAEAEVASNEQVSRPAAGQSERQAASKRELYASPRQLEQERAMEQEQTEDQVLGSKTLAPQVKKEELGIDEEPAAVVALMT